MPESRKTMIITNNNKYKSYQDVRVGTRKEESLETLSETASDCADMTWNGRSFHMLAPATGIARLPTGRYFKTTRGRRRQPSS